MLSQGLGYPGVPLSPITSRKSSVYLRVVRGVSVWRQTGAGVRGRSGSPEGFSFGLRFALALSGIFLSRTGRCSLSQHPCSLF